MTTRAFFKVSPQITILYQFHAQKALFKVPRICIQLSSSEEMNQNLFNEQESPQLPALMNNDLLKNVTRALLVISPSNH